MFCLLFALLRIRFHFSFAKISNHAHVHLEISFLLFLSLELKRLRQDGNESWFELSEVKIDERREKEKLGNMKWVIGHFYSTCVVMWINIFLPTCILFFWVPLYWNCETKRKRNRSKRNWYNNHDVYFAYHVVFLFAFCFLRSFSFMQDISIYLGPFLSLRSNF